MITNHRQKHEIFNESLWVVWEAVSLFYQFISCFNRKLREVGQVDRGLRCLFCSFVLFLERWSKYLTTYCGHTSEYLGWFLSGQQILWNSRTRSTGISPKPKDKSNAIYHFKTNPCQREIKFRTVKCYPNLCAHHFPCKKQPKRPFPPPPFFCV